MQKRYKIFKTKLLNVLSTETNIVKIGLSLCPVGYVRFARHFGKMYSRHLFSYGGLARADLTTCNRVLTCCSFLLLLLLLLFFALVIPMLLLAVALTLVVVISVAIICVTHKRYEHNR